MKKQAEKFSALLISFCIILFSIPVFGIQSDVNAQNPENFKVIKNDPKTFDWEGKEASFWIFRIWGISPLMEK